MIFAPDQVSRDGFAIVKAWVSGGVNNTLYQSVPIAGSTYAPFLQNGAMGWLFLQTEYHRHDLPGGAATMNGASVVVLGMRKNKFHEVEYPSNSDPYTLGLIRTELGDGLIESVDINIASRMNKTVLRYDTE
jgi:hypothetical protein